MNKERIELYGIGAAGSKLIMCNNEAIGMVDYNIYDEKIHIGYIGVNEPHRKRGIAKKVIKNIMNDNPGKYVYGDALSDAVKFWQRLGAEFSKSDDEHLTTFIINY